nr:hypothetical protein [Tanacetum cinerariifolium]
MFKFGRTTNATDSRQSKKELHGIFLTTSFTPQASFKQRLKRKLNESGFKRAFAAHFGQDLETFTGTMFMNMGQLEKQLEKEKLQEIRSMVAFKVLETQFQMFIESRIYSDDEYVKSIDERAQHKREYDSWVNERQMQKTKEKVDTSKAMDVSLVDIESNRTQSKEHDTSSRSGNDAHTDDADIIPIYDEEPMAEFAESSILGKSVLQPHRNQSVVRQLIAFKSKRPRISKQRFVSQVDVNNNLSKPGTTHYLPKGKESACAKPHHMIAPVSSRYSSNDMVHNHYLEEAKKKTQESITNSKPSVMPSTKSQSTVNDRKPKPRINNQKSRN